MMSNDSGSESEYLQSQSDWGAEDDFRAEQAENFARSMPANIKRMKDLYQVAKQAKTGSTIVCPTCGKKHTKTTYQKVFCSNGTKNKAHNCKDQYWNFTDDSRRKRMMVMSGTLDHLRNLANDRDQEYSNSAGERAGIYMDAMMGRYDKQTAGVNVEALIAKIRQQPQHVLELIEKMLK